MTVRYLQLDFEPLVLAPAPGDPPEIAELYCPVDFLRPIEE
ncbi:MAG: hypothetical protein BWY79_01333 [Actinobacteria bacterium ADurb.Bin444]|nr:MAG: hypothetical protein BWY79_01333 [Actinobacteria bacterium ADurb.Bin444]